MGIWIGEGALKHGFTLCTASSLAVGLTLSAAAVAQPVPPAHPGPAIGVPPYEVVAIVRSAGLEPLHRPLRQGPGYVLRALDPAGREVRVIVDGRSGRIVRVAPVAGSPQAAGRTDRYGARWLWPQLAPSHVAARH
jgi:hypothetical protein